MASCHHRAGPRRLEVPDRRPGALLLVFAAVLLTLDAVLTMTAVLALLGAIHP